MAMRGSLNQRSAPSACQLDDELMSSANATAVVQRKVREMYLEALMAQPFTLLKMSAPLMTEHVEARMAHANPQAHKIIRSSKAQEEGGSCRDESIMRDARRARRGGGSTPSQRAKGLTPLQRAKECTLSPIVKGLTLSPQAVEWTPSQ
ncbi:hypothetical protein Fot_37852 [Forsythia ovata]|uniref:Uncharacterized protein n=1 Tax=Forsythia ovata TaxID=205694 RepID=A0ABD1S067_9LAMI